MQRACVRSLPQWLCCHPLPLFSCLPLPRFPKPPIPPRPHLSRRRRHHSLRKQALPRYLRHHRRHLPSQRRAAYRPMDGSPTRSRREKRSTSWPGKPALRRRNWWKPTAWIVRRSIQVSKSICRPLFTPASSQPRGYVILLWAGCGTSCNRTILFIPFQDALA
jgi:hypothetical protein